MGILDFSISLLFLICVSIFTRPISCITDADLFPYGTSDGSSYFNFGDDGKREVRFGSAFTIFNRTRSSIIISGNGVVGFGPNNMQISNSADCTTQPVASDFQKIMAYWSDSFEKNGAWLSYMETTRAPLLQKATQDITKAFTEFKRRDLGLSWLFIVTWRNIPICCAESAGNRQNTFQLVLAKSATRSFVLLYYTKIEWYNDRWAAGFDFGNSRRQYRINGSCTANFQSVTSTSNIGENGKWVYGVESDVKLPSTEEEEEGSFFTIKPRVVSIMGSLPIIIQGPRLEESKNLTITCAFLDPSRDRPSETNGIFVAYNRTEQNIICPVPFLYSLGRIELNLRVKYYSSSITSMYQGHIYVVKEEELGPLPRINTDLRSNVITANWNASSTWIGDVRDVDRTGNHTTDMRSIQIVLLEYQQSTWKELAQVVSSISNLGQIGTYSTRSNMRQFNELLKSSAGKIYPCTFALKSVYDLGSGKEIYKLHPSSTMLTTEQIISSQQVLNPTPQDKSTGNIYDQYCKTWYEKEPHPPTNMDTFPCPRTVAQANLDWRFAHDTESAAQLETFNPGASKSYIQKVATPSGAASQCTYDAQGMLLVRIPGAGRLLRSSPNRRKYTWSHYTQDVLPYLYCCKWGTLKESNCNSFYAKRPSNDGTNYALPQPARVTGLSNIVTFSGSGYTLGRPGEIWMMKYSSSDHYYDHVDDGQLHHTNEFKMQVRLEPYHSTLTNETYKNVTTVTAAVIEDITDEREVNVQVSSNTSQISVIVNGQEEDISFIVDGTTTPFNLYYDGVTISMHSRNRLVASFSSGISMLFIASSSTNESSLNIVVTASPHVTRFSKGWLGDLNVRSRHNVSEWIVQKNESLFYYPNGISYEDYNPKFNSTGMDKIDHRHYHSVPDIGICEGLQECNYVYSLTNSSSISEAERDAKILYEQILNATNSPVHQCKLPDALEHVHFNVSTLVVGSSFTACCEPGYKLLPEEMTFTCQNMDSSNMDESVSWMNGNLSMPSYSCLLETASSTDIYFEDETSTMATDELDETAPDNATPFQYPNVQKGCDHEESNSSLLVVFICIALVTIFVALLIVIAKCDQLKMFRPVRTYIANSFGPRPRREVQVIHFVT